LAVAGFVLGALYKAAIERRVQSHFDKKLETFKSDLRIDEEKLKHSLKSQDDKIRDLRQNLLSNISSRNSVLDKRKIDAAERVWNAVTAHAPYRNVATFSRAINMSKLMEIAWKPGSGQDGARHMADFMLTSSGISGQKLEETPFKERPFVSPLIWALYSAYSRIVTFPSTQLIVAKNGIEPTILNDFGPLLDLAKSILPSWADFIEQHGGASITYLFEPIEERLLSEIRQFLETGGDDTSKFEQATAIVTKLDAIEAASKAAQIAEFPDTVKKAAEMVKPNM
jgi:hypothetical protein